MAPLRMTPLARPEMRRVDEANRSFQDRLVRLVQQVVGSSVAIPDPFPVHRQLSDLGVSSLKMVNLMLAIEMEFDIAIPQEDITPENFHSLSTMEALVARTCAPR